MGWQPGRNELPEYGSVNGEHDVWFKTHTSGETLISDATNSRELFDRGPAGIGGQHEHFGPGHGRNDNGTSRGWYTGPGN